MTEITINASRQYTVSIGKGLLSSVGQTVHQLTHAQKVCVVTDSNLQLYHVVTVLNNLKEAGLQISCFTIPAGESSKNTANYLLLLEFLAKEGLNRNDCIVALGGGVVGDLAGFAAATYLRGIPYIQVPTSLLAMVDSSVGGKTGIDLPAGKNLVGAFYQPIAVICDTDTLATLPEESFRDGCAEIIKYGILFDETLFAHLEAAGMAFDRETVIAKCIAHKRDTVQQDEFDHGNRMLLNLGHTIGHAIEKCSEYTISHGRAVATGIAIVSRGTRCPDTLRILSLLQQFGLPTTTALSAEVLSQAALSDKKRNGNTINLVIPQSIGRCAVVATAVEQLKTFIEEGL